MQLHDILSSQNVNWKPPAQLQTPIRIEMSKCLVQK